MPGVISDTWPSVTRDFEIGKVTGHLTVGFLPTGKPGLVLIYVEKLSPMEASLFNALADLTTLMLQHGVSLEEINRDFRASMLESYNPIPNPGMRIMLTRLFQMLTEIKPPH